MPLSAQPGNQPSRLLRQYFDSLLNRYGSQRWWPARTRLEIILGAILTQNTSWQNAALAIKGLRASGMLTLAALKRAKRGKIESSIRSAGFYRQKTLAIRRFLAWLDKHYDGSLSKMFNRPSAELRDQLLRVKGLGPETVDAILLYAGGVPTFVADAYTRRILGRHALLREGASYEEARSFLHSNLPPDAALFNEFHALLVETGKRHCRRTKPRCEGCPLEPFLPKRDTESPAQGLNASALSDRVATCVDSA